jgi:hypothetical protein
MEMKDNFAELIRASYDEPTPSPELERRVMIEVARRAIERSRRRARRGMVASLTGLAGLLAGCIAALVVWFPTLMPALTDISWMERWRASLHKLFDSAPAAGQSAVAGFIEQWGAPTLLVLGIGVAAGFVWYLNALAGTDDL